MQNVALKHMDIIKNYKNNITNVAIFFKQTILCQFHQIPLKQYSGKTHYISYFLLPHMLLFAKCGQEETDNT